MAPMPWAITTTGCSPSPSGKVQPSFQLVTGSRRNPYRSANNTKTTPVIGLDDFEAIFVIAILPLIYPKFLCRSSGHGVASSTGRDRTDDKESQVASGRLEKLSSRANVRWLRRVNHHCAPRRVRALRHLHRVSRMCCGDGGSKIPEKLPIVDAPPKPYYRRLRTACSTWGCVLADVGIGIGLPLDGKTLLMSVASPSLKPHDN